MAGRYFTLTEANALLPQLQPLMGRLLETRARVVRQAQSIRHTLSDLHSDIGGPVPSNMVQGFITIEQILQRIQSYGCEVKDLNAGLIDFLTERDGRDVYLCWRYGEPEITFYHDLHTGFNGRRPI